MRAKRSWKGETMWDGCLATRGKDNRGPASGQQGRRAILDFSTPLAAERIIVPLGGPRGECTGGMHSDGFFVLGAV